MRRKPLFCLSFSVERISEFGRYDRRFAGTFDRTENDRSRLMATEINYLRLVLREIEERGSEVCFST